MLSMYAVSSMKNMGLTGEVYTFGVSSIRVT